jgi:hypothetical protein
MGEVEGFSCQESEWQKSMDLAVRCYRAAQALPKSEQSGLDAEAEGADPGDQRILVT